jgi:hypothetical protein
MKSNPSHRSASAPALLAALFAALLLDPASPAGAALATVWHIPDDTADLGFNMRNPEFEIGTNTTITLYTGLWKWNNGAQIANQTGGWLIYKGASQSSWSSNALSWLTNTSANQYWQASLNTSAFGPNDVIQYYFLLTFDGFNSVSNTYLYGADSGSSTAASSSIAPASLFSIRNRAAWIWHNGNRVITAGSDANHMDVAFWTKIGYMAKGDDPTSSWVDNAAIYYTTNGAAPSGSLGVPGTNTFAAALNYDHEEDDPSIAGNAMWWSGSVSNLPNYIPIHYMIGVWNNANDEEKFGDYGAAAANTIFNFTNGVLGDPVLTVNGVNADYTTTHVFVNELNGDAIPLTILFTPNTNDVVEADVFSNVNRRDRATNDANGDGIEDGILPPDGNAIPAGDDSNYYKAYAMTPLGNGQYSLTLYVTNTGAYRLTARFMVSGNTNWVWYSSNGRRDHCIVSTPSKAQDIILYELDPMIIGSQGINPGDQSTFVDLYGGPDSRPYDPITNRFNLGYFQNLGVNWLWFQPIHPIGIENRQTNASTGLPYDVGSPYSVKNFFQVNPLLSKSNTRAAAMQEFTNFVAAADAAGINIMLDEPFNHSAWDAELDASGVFYFASNAQPTNLIADTEARFYSRLNEYDQRAYSAVSVAPAPDRYDFGKWTDVADIYYGRYAALVPNVANSGDYTSEGDWFDYSIGSESATGSGNGHFDAITQNVWRYFSDCILYWLDMTGCPAGTPPNQTYKGIDGLRADFGQGLPPQCWEYIINKVRSRKWDFVFMTESLDGGAVTYRSDRHFDILNENLIFSLQSAATASDYRNAFESRRTSYGPSLLLLNNVSHDEESFSDPYLALIRYMACSAIDGAPMTFYGEELGISTTFGFNRYQLNFGKTIPDFMTYNSLQPICSPANRTFGLDQLWPVYAAVNQARSFSGALRSTNRYFLNQTGSETPQPSIFSVAKYAAANASPNVADVVLAFTTLDRNNTQTGVFDVNITQNGSNLFGIQPQRLYNVKNIAAYLGSDPNRRNYWLWNNGAGGLAGSNILSNGIYVSLNPVPTSDAGWATAPFEAQYLKLYDVTPPSAPLAPSTPKSYVLGTNVTFTWPALTDPTGGVQGYNVIVGSSPGASNVFDGFVPGTNLTVSGAFGGLLYAETSAVNGAGIQGPFSPASAGALLLDVNSVRLRVAAGLNGVALSWPANLSNSATLYTTTNLALPVHWSPVAGNPVLTNSQGIITVPFSSEAARFYRLQLN